MESPSFIPHRYLWEVQDFNPQKQQIKNIIDDFDHHLTSIVIAIIISSKTLFRTLYDQRFESYGRLKNFKKE